MYKPLYCALQPTIAFHDPGLRRVAVEDAFLLESPHEKLSAENPALYSPTSDFIIVCAADSFPFPQFLDPFNKACDLAEVEVILVDTNKAIQGENMAEPFVVRWGIMGTTGSMF